MTGEGQPLGIPLSYGGPYLGIFATTQEYVRKMAGRLVGETVDNRGQRAYVLTLTAREQHIRREKATSNICTNQGLMALASTVYMSLLGQARAAPGGRAVLPQSPLCRAADRRAARLSACGRRRPSSTSSSCTARPRSNEINEHLLEHGILGGYDLGQDYPELKNHMLIAVTEMNSTDDIDLLVDVLAEVSHD